MAAGYFGMKSNDRFDPRLAAKKLLREARSGALATLAVATGDPYCSLVNVATAIDGTPLMLLSNLALHTKNIAADARISLMLDERKENDPLEGARIMLMGKCSKDPDPSAARAYLRRHPDAAAYAGFADFSYYRVDVAHAHLVAGFGRIVDLHSRDLLTDITDAAGLIEREAEAIEHMNTDHAEACRLYATRLLGAEDGDWRCVGISPEGIELQKERTALRLPFPQRVTGTEPLRIMLKRLAQEARQK